MLNICRISKPFCIIRLQIGNTLAPADKFKTYLILRIFARFLSGIYRDRIISLIGTCPNTNAMAKSVMKKSDQFSKIEEKYINKICPTEIINKINFGENLSIIFPTKICANEAVA